MSTQEDGSFTIKLDDASVLFSTQMANARRIEAAAWLELTSALTVYIGTCIDVWSSAEVGNLRDTFLPDLFDQIVVEVQDAQDPAKIKEVL